MPSAEVLLEHAEFLRRLARGILHDADAADDVAQDAIVAALGERPANLRAWLGKVARHLALSRRRAEARRELREHEAARPERLPSAAEGVARLELQRQVVDAVLALDEPYRSVVVHRFFYDLGPVEIAKRLGVPVETVRTRLRRALETLRARLDASHGRRAWSVALLAIAVPRKLPLGGILAMSAKTKLVAASVLVLACAAVGVSMLGRRESPAPRAPVREEARVEPEAVEPPPVAAAAPVDFATIDRDRDVHGVVVDPAGNPLAGADVRVVRYPAMGMAGMLAQAEAEEGPGTQTASDGTFALRVERGEEVDVRVKADGFVPLQRRWCPAGGKVRIVMRKGVRLRVHAIGPDGAALPGVHVVAFKGGPDPEMEAAGFYVFLEGTTDERGTCVLQDLLPGHRTMLHGWHPDLHIPKPVAVQLPETGEVEAQLAAVRARDVTGRVTDAATGEPVAGALVVPYPVPVPLVKAATTGANGAYRYPNWSSEGVGENLYVHAEGHATVRETVGDRAQVDFALQRGNTVMGIVRDARGNPVGGAYVAAEARGVGDRPEGFVFARSDARGRFELRSLGSDLSQTLIVTKPGFARIAMGIHEAQFVSSVGRVPLLEVVLPDARRLEGRVLGPDGEPFEGALVELNTAPRTQHKHERHTDDLGRFRFADLASGSYSILVTTADRRRMDRTVAIEQTDVLDVEMRFERGREFTVRVVDEAGQPVRNVLLASGPAEKRTDADGRAVLDVPQGSDRTQVYVARLPGDRFVRPPSPDYRLGQGELRIVLPEAATISGRVLLDGEPLPYALMAFSGPGVSTDAQVTDKEGKFSARVPARTDVKVALSGQFGKLGSNGQWDSEFLPIYGEELVAAGTTDVVIRARRVPLDRTLVVRVTGPDGTGVEGMQVSVGARGYRSEKPPMTDANGRVELSGLPAGGISVGLGFGRAPAPWSMPRSTSAEVVPDGQEVVFSFREAKAIRGIILMPDGTGAATGVVAWRGEQYVANALSEKDGTFALYVPADEPEPVRVESQVVGKGAPGLRGEIDGVLPGAEGVTIRLRAE